MRNETYLKDTAYFGGSVSTVRYENDVNAENCKFTAPEKGSMWFDGNVTLKDCEIVDTTGGSINIGETGSKKTLALKGGNTFTSYASQDITIQTKSATAEGDNYFYGATNVNRLKVISGKQTFENKMTDSAQTMAFNAVGFDANADDSAAIDVSVDRGWLFFRDDCTISSLETANCTLRVWNSLTVKDSITFNTGTSFDLNASKNAVIILEIDSLSELMNMPSEVALFGANDGSTPMLTLGDGVSLGDNAKVELMFTKNAIEEMQEYEGPITFNLEKVTNAADVKLNLTIEKDLEDQGMTATQVFGSNTTFTTGEAGSSDNQVTINAIPEPTTATLSLLALAGLCARRRRA
ncbi:MAG: PEP-CTERM sorting domain-containing protein [Akkermansia sp.]|nr:PEP-CTERM sorting domain-containing protein [Akkermansia sp.]